jgi:hypothetical protein
MSSSIKIRIPLLAVLVSSLSGFGQSEERGVLFNRDIRPIMSDTCFLCHGPDSSQREADLRLDTPEGAYADREGSAAIIPGDPDESLLIWMINAEDEEDIMPPLEHHRALTKEEKDLFYRWIEQGAEYDQHWAFVAPTRPTVPAFAEDPPTNAIDAFIRKRLEQEGLTFSAEADRATLIRRLSFDLTGLPPKLEEVYAFVSDPSPDAYEKQVDRLLASPHFGERMALMWLDAARYGDSSVMHADGPRDMWPWRDWVIDAYNSNQPYDQFSIEQIAGDLLADATVAQKIATGFNRNHPSSDEGGAIPEELRVGYVVDRVKTTSNVWLGLTMECAQCHDHKYDPISQKEYYQFYAYFNNTADPGMQTRKENQAPLVELVSMLEEQQLKKIDNESEAFRVATKRAREKALEGFEAWLAGKDGSMPPSEDNEDKYDDLKHFFPLDEPSGHQLTDVRSRMDAVGETLVKSVPGKFGGAIELDGGTNFVAPDIQDPDRFQRFTLSAWVKIDSDFTGAILSKMDPALSLRGFDLWIENGRPGIHVANAWPESAIKVLTDHPVLEGEWQHIAASYSGNGKSDGIKIYVNGQPWCHSVQNASEIPENQQDDGRLFNGTIVNRVPLRIGGRTDDAFFKGLLDDVRIYSRVLSEEEIFWTKEDSIGGSLQIDPEKRSSQQEEILTENYLATTADAYRESRSHLLRSLHERSKITYGKITSMVMKDNPEDERRMTYILDRGAYDSPIEDEELFPATPGVLPPLPEGAPANRLTLANWLFSDEHPLTSRVAVNQLWQLFFGNGLVSTPSDFGNQGAFPTHPELLDWLAVDFRESGWDMKRMIKQIVMTRTYRQASNVQAQHLEMDASNQLLARAPRHRLQAEMIRDNALAVSGLLVDDIGGPGVKPYQPPGLWEEVSLGGVSKFVQDIGEDLYRRSLYTYWKRSVPHPAMLIFDAPNRETCVLKRPNTNTPLQALAAMNDIQVIEASRHFAERVIKEGGPSLESKVRFAFELATARPPTPRETATVLEVFENSHATYTADEAKGAELLSAGESERDASVDLTEHAAWTLVCSMIFNLDEVLTRN